LFEKASFVTWIPAAVKLGAKVFPAQTSSVKPSNESPLESPDSNNCGEVSGDARSQATVDVRWCVDLPTRVGSKIADEKKRLHRKRRKEVTEEQLGHGLLQ